jgi:hypothetical protein
MNKTELSSGMNLTPEYLVAQLACDYILLFILEKESKLWKDLRLSLD